MPYTAAEYRRQAMRWADQAEKARDPVQRERLLKMRDAFLELAKTEDWLNGRSWPNTSTHEQKNLAG
jgi:hypothetical protein